MNKSIILTAVAKHFNMDRNELRVKNNRKYVLARHIAAYLMREKKYNNKQIGDCLWKKSGVISQYMHDIQERPAKDVMPHLDAIRKTYFDIKGYEWIPRR